MRWRFYRTSLGARPVEAYLEGLPREDRAAIYAAMLEARAEGLRVARHVEGDLYELRVAGSQTHYRLLFARETRYVLLGLDAYQKASQRMPLQVKRRALDRLRDWRARGGGADGGSRG